MNPALDSRARFEAHRLEKTGRVPKTWGNCELVGCKVWGRLADRYVEGCEQTAWEAWQAAIASTWIPVGERLPEVGVTVLVYEPSRPDDWPDTVRIFFDYISPDWEDWNNHCESYEHFMVIGGSRAAGPDVECTGPSEKAPYTHWCYMPAPPAPQDTPIAALAAKETT